MASAEQIVQPASGDAPPAEQSVGAKARGALGWSLLNTLIGKVGSTFVGIVLARILVPEDYGIFAVSLVALNALLSVNELGVSLAIVRWPGSVDRIAPTVVTLAWSSSIVLWVLAFLTAPSIANLMNAPEATNVLRLLTLSVLIDAFTTVPSAEMTREFMQKQRLVVDLAGFVVTSSLSIGLAIAGLGAWSLVVSVLIGNVINGLFIARLAPRWHWPGFRADVARELLVFGIPLAFASLLVFGLLNVDYVVVGAQVTPVALGLYLLAFNLSSWPVGVFSAPARRVSMPAFARLHAGDGDATAAFVTACTAMILVTLPACLLLALYAQPLIHMVYGPKWSGSAAVLPWLMVLAVSRVLSELAYDFLVALNRSPSTLFVQGVWLCALIPALLIGAHVDGIRGVAIGHAVVCLVVALPAYVVVVTRAGVSALALAKGLARPFGAGLAAAAAGAVILMLGWPDILEILVGGALTAAVYLALVFPMRRILMPAQEPA